MKKILAFLLLIPAISFANIETGMPAPDFTGTDSNGNSVKLSDYKGHMVVLEWTNHKCPFVEKYYSEGHMQALQEKYTAKDVKWLRVISSAKGKQGHVFSQEANALIERQKVKASATLLDESGAIGRLYGAKTTPHMFVIDKDGNIAYQGAIDSIHSTKTEDIAKATPYVSDALDALEEGKMVEPSTTAPYGCGVKY